MLKNTVRFLVAAGAVLYSLPAAASDHWFFVRSDSPKTATMLDLGALGPSQMSVSVFSNNEKSTVVTLNNNLFASVNLSTLVGGLSIGELYLGRAISSVPLFSNAALRTTTDHVAVPALERSLGPAFAFPVAGLGAGTSVLIGNPNGIDVEVRVDSVTGSQVVLVHPLRAVEVPLVTPSSRYVVISLGQTGSQTSFIAAVLYYETVGSRVTPLSPI